MIKEVSDPIYNQRVFLIHNASPKQIAAHCEKNKIYDFSDVNIFERDETNMGSTFWAGGLLYIWIESSKEWEDTLVHEIGHVCLSILDNAGFVVDDDSKHEPFCYLLGYYYSVCMKRLKPYMEKCADSKAD